VIRPARRRRFLAFAIGPVNLVLFAGIVVLLFAAESGGRTRAPLGPALAFLPAICAVAVALALVGLVLALLRRPTRRIALFAAVTCALVAVAGGGLVVQATPPASAAQVEDRSGVRVLVWNTNQGAVPIEAVAELVGTNGPDILVLPEYSRTRSEQLAQTAALLGYTMHRWERASATAFVTPGLGEYRLDESDLVSLAGFVIRPVDPASASPTIVATHLQRPSLTDDAAWNEHLDWVARQCEGENVIVAGDFNAGVANLDAGALAGCRDVAAELGTEWVGTWPTWLPPTFGAQIDRVMTTPEWRPRSFEILRSADDAGSDHRPVLSVLDRSQPAA
jgi:endonuclease/exonuclease/phosphatase (EEP) superfamily protein YafD